MRTTRLTIDLPSARRSLSRLPHTTATRPLGFLRITSHETRNTDFIAVRFAMGAKGSHHEKPESGHCFPEPVCVALCGIARQGAPRAGVRAPSASATRPLGFLRITRHETRITNHGFYGSTAVRHFFWSERGLHQWFSRITRHETRLLSPPGPPCTPPGRCFPARCGAAWGGYGAAWAAYCPRAGVRASFTAAPAALRAPSAVKNAG